MKINELQDIIYDLIHLIFPTIGIFYTKENFVEDELSPERIMLSLGSHKPIGKPEILLPNSSGVSTIKQQSEAILEIIYYGIENGTEPIAKLNDLYIALKRREIKTFLLNNSFSLILNSDIKDISTVFNHKTEKRGNVSFVVRYVFTDTDTGIGRIESVSVTGHLNDNGNNLPITVEVDSTP